ncbi:MAG: hypothetical protein OXH97_08505 [Chloroflexota bacterium]|nr:hypothetical protein [Chloroflexota bacterium]
MVHDVEAIPAHIDTPRQLAAEVYGDASLDILIAGDSHYERLVHRDGMLLLDPGSPTFPHHQRTRLGSVAIFELTTDGVRAKLVPLGDTPDAPNPTTPPRSPTTAPASSRPQSPASGWSVCRSTLRRRRGCGCRSVACESFPVGGRVVTLGHPGYSRASRDE